MSANPSPAFRIGVLLSGTMIAEHVLRDRRPFSIGQSTRTTVCLPVEVLPRHWDLLSLVDGGVELRLAEGMDARVSIGAEVWTRPELERRGTTSRGVITVVLPFTARGRIELPEVRILFQGVRVPAVVARPVLPRALRGTLADRVDGRLAALAAASILGHFGLMIVAHLNDPPGETSMARRATESYQDETIAVIDADDPLLDLATPAPAPDPTTAPAPAVQTPSKPEPSRPAPPTTPGQPRPSPVDPGTVADPTADATRLADLLFAPDDGRGPGAGDLSAREPGSDLAQQLQEVVDSGANTSIGDGTTQRPVDDRGPLPGTSTGPDLGDPPTVPIVTPPKDDEKVPPGRIRPTPPPRRPDGPDVDSIIKKINTTYMGGLQRCYKKSLLGDATLAGKIILTFTVTDRGVTTDFGAAGIDDKLESCVEGLMKSWSFTPVVDKDGDPTDVDLRLPLQLTPH